LLKLSQPLGFEPGTSGDVTHTNPLFFFKVIQFFELLKTLKQISG